jgi:hypothetical protein
MEPPIHLTDRVTAARRAVAEDPAHDLGLGWRRAIWAALEPTEGEISLVGKRRRARLALVSAQHVHDVWRRRRSDDDLPGTALALAAGLLDDPDAAGEHSDDVGRLWAQVDAVPAEAGDRSWLLVGYAAVAALRTALFDEAFSASLIDLEASDLELDPYTADAAFWAAGAYASGPPMDPASDPDRRREFWEWWLTEAVPEALRTEP